MVNNLHEQLKVLVKKNKKYSAISDDIIDEEISSYLKKNPRMIDISKQAVKDIRSRLHRLYGSYQTKKKNKRFDFLKSLEDSISRGLTVLPITEKLLSMVLSTKERLVHYNFVYDNIFSITGKPGTIVDIGCGMNPLSILLMENLPRNYFCYDIGEDDICFINKFFNIMSVRGIKGHAEVLDIRKSDSISRIENSDIVFMFKLIDLLDTKKNKISGSLIKELIYNSKTKFIVASFATRTLSQRPMNLPKRIGFELMLKRFSLDFKSFSIPGEIFYIISRT